MDSLVSLSFKTVSPCGSTSTATNASPCDESVFVEHSSDLPLCGFELDEDDVVEQIITADNLCEGKLPCSLHSSSGLVYACWYSILFTLPSECSPSQACVDSARTVQNDTASKGMLG